MTKAEYHLWRHIRSKQLGVKFRRQHIISGFIVDFYCHPLKLVIEVDGKIHQYRQEYDESRTRKLETRGVKVVRFSNDEVLGDVESVLDKIIQTVYDRLESYRDVPTSL